MLNRLFSRVFLSHHAHGPSFYVMQQAHAKEKWCLKNTGCFVLKSKVGGSANIALLHVPNMFSKDDTKGLMLSAITTLHVSKESSNTTSDLTSLCVSPWVIGLYSVLDLQKWHLSGTDAKSAFLQTCLGQCVYVLPPRKSASQLGIFWLLLTASRYLVNASAKVRSQTDSIYIDHRFNQVFYVLRMFFYHPSRSLEALVANVVDDILVTNKNDVVNQFLKFINAKYKF